MAGKKGSKRAIIAIAHKIAVIAYHILTAKEPYRELGADHLKKRQAARQERRLVNQLQQLGYKIMKESEPGEEAATA